jgi:hypothetical protein
MATKNAMAQFLGYTSWAHFITEIFDTATTNPEKADEPPVVEGRTTVRGKKIWIAALISAILLITAGLLFFPENNKIVFIGKNTSATAPHAVAISYDLSHFDFHNAGIDFDDAQFQPITNKKSEILYSFKLPNFYRVRLLADSRIVATTPVDMYTNGWVSVIGNNPSKIKMITEKNLFQKEGQLYLSPGEVAKNGINTNEEYWVDFRNVRNYHVDGDNAIIEVKIRNGKNIGGIDCYDASIEYVGEEGRGRYKFVKPGCTEYAYAQFGDVLLNGNFHNLSSLGIDLTEWTIIRIEVINKTASVYVNNHLKYKTTYNSTIGNIRGFICRFKGSGSMDYIRLYDSKKKLRYDDEFN